jgi:hypothetical protein
MFNTLNQLYDWLGKVLSSGTTGQPSSKRLIALLATLSLILTSQFVGIMCAKHIFMTGDIGTGAVSALLGLATILASLAGVAYSKKEVRQDTEQVEPGRPEEPEEKDKQ